MRKQDQDPEPHTSPELISSDTITRSVSGSSLATPSYPGSCNPQATAGDDNSLRREPTKQVDYFSHNWKEEDIWSSWRHVVAKRKSYSNSPRLENASWRTWTKSKYRLKTTSPDKLDWYAGSHIYDFLAGPYLKLTFNRRKDHDVTWLYGPFQSGSTKSLDSSSASSASRLSRSNSFSSKKPILKKRSLSEMMLQKSLSSSTLMRQATDALRAQHSEDCLRDRPIFKDRALSDIVTPSKLASPAVSRHSTAPPSASTSGAHTPCTKRHIHFNNNVQQCIAINKCEDYYSAVYEGSSSEEDLLMMKRVHSSRFKPGNTPRNSFSSESKTIAMLPSTTLKYRGDTPEPLESKSNRKSILWNTGLTLSPSPSQETLKPMSLKAKFLLDDEDDDVDMNWQPMATRWESQHSIQSQDLNHGDSPHSIQSQDLNYGSSNGMRRAPSGMFVPREEGDERDPKNPTGFLGKMIDTVNTAKDIIHVIWNVGWRR